MSFDEDATGSLQTGSSVTRSAMGISMNVSNGADADCERDGAQSRHTRIGRASPVLKRVPIPKKEYPGSANAIQISYQMMTYPLVYMVIWTIPTVIRIYQATTGKSAPFAVGTIDKVRIISLRQ